MRITSAIWKCHGPVLWLTVFGMLTLSAAEPAESPSTRSELRIIEKDHERDGSVLAHSTRYYRGDEHVPLLTIVTYRRPSGEFEAGGGWRQYRVNGKLAILEEDPKGDRNVLVTIFPTDGGDKSNFEEFRRTADGKVTPQNPDDLEKSRTEYREMMQSAKDTVGVITDSMNSHSTAEEVIADLKKQVEELKKRLNEDRSNGEKGNSQPSE